MHQLSEKLDFEIGRVNESIEQRRLHQWAGVEQSINVQFDCTKQFQPANMHSLPDLFCITSQLCNRISINSRALSGNAKEGSITVPLTYCFTGLDEFVLQIKTKTDSCHSADSKPVK
jgi:hypothetical protein